MARVKRLANRHFPKVDTKAAINYCLVFIKLIKEIITVFFTY